jgi:hypothetical protein
MMRLVQKPFRPLFDTKTRTPAVGDHVVFGIKKSHSIYMSCLVGSCGIVSHTEVVKNICLFLGIASIIKVLVLGVDTLTSKAAGLVKGERLDDILLFI